MATAVIELTGAGASFKLEIKSPLMAEQYINDINQPRLGRRSHDSWQPMARRTLPSIVVAFLSCLVTDRFNSQMMEIIAP